MPSADEALTGHSRNALWIVNSIASTATVPEPATWVMALAGLARGGLMRRRRRE